MRSAYTIYSLLVLLLFEVASANFEGRSAVARFGPVVSPITTTEEISSLKEHRPAFKISPSDTLVSRGGAAVLIQNGLPKALAGAVVFAAIEKAVKMGLSAANIQYPAQLGACILLFFVMCLTDVVNPKAAAYLFDSLSPAAALLAKWFPIFFIPGLVLLPLSPPIGGTVDVSVKISGLLYNIN